MALNQMIAQGAQFNVPDPVAQYAKMQQLQAVQNQNALAQYQLGSAQRGDAQQNALYARLKDPTFSQDNPQDLASLSQFGTPGIQAMKAITDAANARQTGQKVAGEMRDQQRKELYQIVGDLSSTPTDEKILKSKKIIEESTYYSPEVKQQALNLFDSALSMPLQERKTYFSGQGSTAGERMTAGTATQDRMSRELVASANRASQEKTAGNRLQFDQTKFNWEKANPGYSIQDSSAGLVAVNLKNPTDVRPISVGGQPVQSASKAKDASVSEQNAAYNIGRVLSAANQIKEVGKKDASAVQPGPSEAFASSIGMSGTANLARDANRQIVYGAQRDALDALLYLATGAAYNKEQLEGQMIAYVPSFTDKPEAVAAKKDRMTSLIKTAKIRAGKAWTPEMDSAMNALISPASSSGAPASAGEATGDWKVVK